MESWKWNELHIYKKTKKKTFVHTWFFHRQLFFLLPGTWSVGLGVVLHYSWRPLHCQLWVLLIGMELINQLIRQSINKSINLSISQSMKMIFEFVLVCLWRRSGWQYNRQNRPLTHFVISLFAVSETVWETFHFFPSKNVYDSNELQPTGCSCMNAVSAISKQLCFIGDLRTLTLIVNFVIQSPTHSDYITLFLCLF